MLCYAGVHRTVWCLVRLGMVCLSSLCVVVWCLVGSLWNSMLACGLLSICIRRGARLNVSYTDGMNLLVVIGSRSTCWAFT